MYLKDEQEARRHRISALLRERFNKGLPTPCLQFDPKQQPHLPNTVPLRVDELLATWPESVPERIERSLPTLTKRIGVGIAGRQVEIQPPRVREYVPLAIDNHEQEYFFTAMKEYEWIELKEGPIAGYRKVCLTPKGWAKYDELTRTESSSINPAFVAMWFGGRNRREEMDDLLESSIRPAVEAAGYRVKRADEDEHNEPIMDRIIADIRVAPFVVAELTGNNPGVYYEAGFARGLNREVIYCWPEAQEKVHFDVSGVNHVRWKDPADLRRKLENRILGTLGEGPHSFRQQRIEQ